MGQSHHQAGRRSGGHRGAPAAGLLCARARKPHGSRGSPQCMRLARLARAGAGLFRAHAPHVAMGKATAPACAALPGAAGRARRKRTPQFDVDLVPVAIFWGRAPHKEVSWWRLLFTEDWVLVGRFRKLLNVIVNGRNTVVYFGEPMRLRDAMQDDMTAQRSVRRLLRSLRAELRAQRASTIGPDLSHRRTMVPQILKTQAVRHAVRDEMQARGLSRRAALLRRASMRSRSRPTIHSPSSPSWPCCSGGCGTAPL